MVLVAHKQSHSTATLLFGWLFLLDSGKPIQEAASMASTASSNTVQPISFDKADQVNAQLASLEQRIEEHVQAAARGKDKAFAEQIRAILREVRRA